MRPGSLFAVVVLVGVSSAASQALARKATISEQDQTQALLAQLAAASAEAAPEQRTDADLMYEAMKQWQGEPRGSAAIDQALAQSKRDIGRDRKVMQEKIRSMFWRDPFAEESQRLVPVRKADRDLLTDYRNRHARSRVDSGNSEVARLRAEVAEARADAVAARAETSRLRAELGRVEEQSGGGQLAEGQTGCAPAAVSRHARRAGNDRGHPAYSANRMEALNSPAPSGANRHASVATAKAHGASGATWIAKKPAAQSVPVVVLPVNTVGLPPAGWRSSDPRGIIVVPIEAPVAIRADKPHRAR